mgnify:CR=1 FL=1
MSLERFLSAQERDYEIAISEIRRGRKQSHWMWYIFPQIQGLGYSSMAQFYAISDKEIFRAVLEKFFDGELDKKTLDIINCSK